MTEEVSSEVLLLSVLTVLLSVFVCCGPAPGVFNHSDGEKAGRRKFWYK
jgi:hypothetical protein